MARCAASPRTIALLKERLVLGASRLHIGRHCGGYRGKSYEGKTHMILLTCLWGTKAFRDRFHRDQGGDHYGRIGVRRMQL